MPKKNKKSIKPDVHEELEGFDIGINAFGEISTSIKVDKINDFLNENVEDRKLKEAEQSNSDEEAKE